MAQSENEKTEKITINLGLVDLGQIDLLVQEGFYTNRTDFIRTAIRPLGLPGGAVTLALDGLAEFFLLLPLAIGLAAAAAALDDDEEDAATLPFLPALLGAMLLAVLAGDAFALVLGLGLAAVASGALVLTRHDDGAARAAALSGFGMALLGTLALMAALALLAGGAGWDVRFAAIARRAGGGLAGRRRARAGARRGRGERRDGAAPRLAAAGARGGAGARLRAPLRGDDQGRALRTGARAVRPRRPGPARVVGRAAHGAGCVRRRRGRAPG